MMIFSSKATKKVNEPDLLSKKYFYLRSIAAFSHEDEEHRVTENKPEDGQKLHLNMLTDDDLRAALLVYGVKAGPIVEESSEENEQLEEQECSQVDMLSQNGPGYQQCFLSSSRMHFVACASRNVDVCHKLTSEQVPQSTQAGGAVQTPKEKSSASALDQHSGLGAKVSSRPIQDSNCSPENFSITEAVEEVEKRMVPVPDSELNESDVHKLWTESNRLDMLVADKKQSQYFTPEEETLSNWEAKDPMKEDLLPDTKPKSTKISATCRRPIKGAAGRLVEYNRPKLPASPTTLERREIDHRMVPVQIRIVVFVVVAFLLFFIVESEPLGPLLALTYNFMQGCVNDAPVLQSTQTCFRHQ
ncbi:uncharacterized protein LOC144060595 isoform X3 [Vanacampus margaritifer]